MIRLSDIMQKAPPVRERREVVTPPARLERSPPAPASARGRPGGRAVSFTRLVGAPPASREGGANVLTLAEGLLAAEAGYQGLLGGAQQVLDRVAHDERVDLGTLPDLMEHAMERLARGEESLFRLATLGDAGFSLASHGVNVAILTMRVGMARDIRRSVLVDLGLAGLLQDIGMVKLQHLLHAPTQFGPDQRTQMHAHPILGRELVRDCPSLTRFIREVIAQEHERVDGSGYPDGLTGERISDEAQLVGLLDCYEALTHDRPYRTRLSSSEAVRTIVQHQRQAFGPDLLRTFLDTIPIYPVGSWVRLTTGESARVRAFTPRSRLAPVVDILVNRQGQPLGYPQTVDLSRNSLLAIARAIPPPAASAVGGSAPMAQALRAASGGGTIPQPSPQG